MTATSAATPPAAVTDPSTRRHRSPSDRRRRRAPGCRRPTRCATAAPPAPRCSPPTAAGRPATRPVWFMRQAGRSLPEYRKARGGTGMLEACLTPDLAAEITLQPVRRHRVDAAILFSDIVVPLKLAGIDVEIVPGHRAGGRAPDPDRRRRRRAARRWIRRRWHRSSRPRPATVAALGLDPADRVRRRPVHPGVLPGRGRSEPRAPAHQGDDARRPGDLARAGRPGSPA